MWFQMILSSLNICYEPITTLQLLCIEAEKPHINLWQRIFTGEECQNMSGTGYADVPNVFVLKLVINTMVPCK